MSKDAKAGTGDFGFGYETAWFGDVRVVVPVTFAAALREEQAASGAGKTVVAVPPQEGAEDADRTGQASSSGLTFPGLGLGAGTMAPPLLPSRAVVPTDGRSDSGALTEPLWGGGLAAALTDAAASFPVRLCTPTMLPEVEELMAEGLPEMSVSVGSLGSHLTGEGPLGRVAAVAARQRGASGALMSVSGCTGSNRVAVGMIARAFPGRPIAVPVNAHHSVLNAAQMFGVPVVFLKGQRMLAEFEAVLPPTASDVAALLREHPDVAAVWVTSPSYEGVVAAVEEIAAVVHEGDPDRLLVVDQAWGAHLGFSSSVPESAIRWADLVCESTHKQGGAPNQAGVLLWSGDRVDEQTLMAAYRAEVTTSPSMPLLAASELALKVLGSPRGRARLRRIVRFASDLGERLRSCGFSVLDLDRVAAKLDPMKVTVSTDSVGWSGYGLAAFLAERGIVVERAGLRSLVMIVGYSVTDADVGMVAEVFQEAVVLSPGFDTSGPPSWLGHGDAGVLDLRAASSSRSRSKSALRDASGLVAGELVECYPPGIAVIVPGMTITDHAIAYLEAVRAAGGTVVGGDPVDGQITVLRAQAGEVKQRDAEPADALAR